MDEGGFTRLKAALSQSSHCKTTSAQFAADQLLIHRRKTAGAAL